LRLINQSIILSIVIEQSTVLDPRSQPGAGFTCGGLRRVTSSSHQRRIHNAIFLPSTSSPAVAKDLLFMRRRNIKRPSTAHKAQTTASMNARLSTDDVISISSSSDSDSDCRIVRVVPSPSKRGKNKTARWESKPSTVIRWKREAAMTGRRGREMMTRQRGKADDKDRLGTKSTSRVYRKWLTEDSMERRRDAVCDGRLQGTKQTLLRDGHLSVTGEDAQANHQHSVDPNLSTASFPFLSQGSQRRLEVRHQGGDDHRGARSRSCSTATLDFSPRMRAALLEDDTDGGRDKQELFSMLDGSSDTIEFDDAPRCLEWNSGGAVSPSNAYPTPSLETMLKGESNADGARLTRKRRSRHKSHANDDPSRSTGGSRHRISAWAAAQRDRHQLPPIRSGPMWESIINVGAFSALPGPLFTRPKRVLREVTYEDTMRERARRKRKQELTM
ncbi:Hypothetical protein TRIREDRAFT_104089, partial [Trichoderma reesei QM6a]